MSKLGPHPDRERRERIAKLRAEGLTFAEIGAKLGITRQGAEMLLRASGAVELPAILCRECGRIVGRTDRPAKLKGALCLECLANRPLTTIAERIRAFRLAAGLSQRALSRKTGITVQSLANYERGASAPDWNKVVKLVRLFGPHLIDVENALGVARLKKDPVYGTRAAKSPAAG